jgi:hypothetical protein
MAASALVIEKIPEELHDLLIFCDRESTRYQLGSPTVIGDWVYATNARIAVRRPNFTGTQFVVEKYPDIEKLFKPLDRDQCVHTVTFPNDMHCKFCKDERFIESTECCECDGEGTVEHECDCEYCYIDHEGKCEECDGSGEVEPYMVPCDCSDKTVYMSSDRPFFASMGIASLLHKLPGLKVSSATNSKETYFVADGGIEGLFMPLSR